MERPDVIAFLYARIRMLVAIDVILQLSAIVLLFTGVATQQADVGIAGGVAVLLLGLVALPLINKFHAARVTVPDERTVDLPFDQVLDLVAKKTSTLAGVLPSSRRATVDRAVDRGHGGADATFTRRRATGVLVVRVKRLGQDKTVVAIHGTDLQTKYLFRVLGIRIPSLYAGSYQHRLRREIFYFLDYHASRARAADGQTPGMKAAREINRTNSTDPVR